MSYKNFQKENSLHEDAAAAGTAWWAFFATKEFLIGAVAIGGVISIIKALGNTIKGRFNKCAKLLYTMQRDFGTKENGMDLKAVLPGVGSKITDFATKLFGSKRNKNKGALGLRPFVDNYRNEIGADYKEACKALDMIALAGEELDKKKANNQTTGQINNFQGESVQHSYSSFYEMFKANSLNESENFDTIRHKLILENVTIKGGTYVFTSIDDHGRETSKTIQVTPQSTREICYSILNMFFGKYFNMNEVAKKMGMNIDSLGDIDDSSINKFIKFTGMMKQQLTSVKSSKMYTRVENNYNNMIDAYIKLANTVVDNFEKYTKSPKDSKGNTKRLSEKDANLLATAVAKLKAEVSRQNDAYKSNFFRVLNAIITSPECTTYIDFINEKVMPVFKTGNAGDADFVLDVAPKNNEYYVIRQTNGQSVLKDNDTVNGNTALVKIQKFENKSNNPADGIITFSRIALIKNPNDLRKNDKGEYDLSSYSENNFDKTAFSKKAGETDETAEDSITLEYRKWISLDPIIVTNLPEDIKTDKTSIENTEEGKHSNTTKLYFRTVKLGNDKELDEYVFGVSEEVKESLNTNVTDKTLYEDDDTRAAEVGQEANDSNAAKDSSSNDISIDNEDKNIDRIICANTIKGSKLADINANQFNGIYVLLNNKCSAKEINDVLKNLGFSAFDEKTTEKNLIINNTKNKVELNNISTIDKVIKQLENGENNEAGTPSEKILNNIDSITDKLLNEVQSKNFTIDNLTRPYEPGGARKRFIFYTYPKTNNYDYILFNTEIKNKNGKDIGLCYYPVLLDVNGKPKEPTAENNKAQNASTSNAQVNNQNGQNGNIQNNGASTEQTVQNANGHSKDAQNAAVKNTDGIVGIAISVKPINMPEIPYRIAKLDKESIKAAIESLIKECVEKNIMESIQTKIDDAIRESFKVAYDKAFNIAESYMSSFGFKGDKLHVNRKIKGPKSKFTYYALSENAWGDGSQLDPEKYLQESLDNILCKYNKFDDIAVIAKNSPSINLIKISEDCSYNTAFPNNRYQMLTSANPLYENLAIVRFNERGKLVEIIKHGVKKIYTETA